MVFQIGGWWPFISYFVGYCFQDLFNIAYCILVLFPSSYASIRFVSVYVVHPYSRIDTTAAWKKLTFILSFMLYFHMIDNQSIEIHAFSRCILMLLSVDEMLLTRYVDLSNNFRESPFRVEISTFFNKKQMYSILSVTTWRPIQTMQQGIGLCWCINQKRYVICIVFIHNSFSRLSYSYLFLCKAIFFH